MKVFKIDEKNNIKVKDDLAFEDIVLLWSQLAAEGHKRDESEFSVYRRKIRVELPLMSFDFSDYSKKEITLAELKIKIYPSISDRTEAMFTMDLVFSNHGKALYEFALDKKQDVYEQIKKAWFFEGASRDGIVHFCQKPSMI